MKLEWYQIDINSDGTHVMSAAAVSGGYFVTRFVYPIRGEDGCDPIFSDMIFVADPHHRWKIEE